MSNVQEAGYIIVWFGYCRFGVTLGNLIWAVFGMVSAAEFDASSVLETTIGKMLLGLWVVAAVVLLVIMFGAIIMKRMQITQVHYNQLFAVKSFSS